VLDVDPSLACRGAGLDRAVGVGPVFPGVVTVVSVIVCWGAPGRTTEHVVEGGQEDGPEGPLQVVVWPVQVQEAGQVEMVVTDVTVVVEFG